MLLCQKRVALEQQLERLVLQVPVLFSQGPEICQHYAEQATALKRAGTQIGANELWIACHALAEGATVVTNNRREFQRIAGLPLANWVSRSRCIRHPSSGPPPDQQPR